MRKNTFEFNQGVDRGRQEIIDKVDSIFINQNYDMQVETLHQKFNYQGAYLALMVDLEQLIKGKYHGE